MKTKPKYPLSVPWVPPGTLEKVAIGLEKQVQQGDGDFSRDVTLLLDSEHFKGFSNFLTPSCTASLEIASLAIGLQPGDEVITPSFNFTSGALSLSKFGAKPVFVDIDLVTGCIDTNQITEAIGHRTKAISWVNYAGSTPNQEVLREIARQNNLVLIEDHAHGFGLAGNSIKYGIGDFIVSSFHATKNIQCGEGGHIGVFGSELTKKVQVIREKGTNRTEFMSGLAKKYRWVGEGGSYLLPEICSAVLLNQIENFKKILEKRRRILSIYEDVLKTEVQNIEGISFRPNLVETAHSFSFLLPSAKFRSFIIRDLLQFGIQAASHYEDLASSPHGKKVGRLATTNQKSLEISQRIIRLPVHMNLTEGNVEFIAKKAVKSIQKCIREQKMSK